MMKRPADDEGRAHGIAVVSGFSRTVIRSADLVSTRSGCSSWSVPSEPSKRQSPQIVEKASTEPYPGCFKFQRCEKAALAPGLVRLMLPYTVPCRNLEFTSIFLTVVVHEYAVAVAVPIRETAPNELIWVG
jgi:hypothetical protein